MSGLRFAVIGTPVSHSRSPAMHAAAYRALGMPHVYEAIDTDDAQLASRIAALRAGDYAGLNVTIPHKERVLGLVDAIDPSAQAIGAANTLVRTARGGVRAHNTDAPALAEEIAKLLGRPARTDALVGASAIVIGAGGAARAAVVALAADLGAARVTVRARALVDSANAAAFADDMGARLSARGVSSEIVAEGLGAPEREDAALRAIVQATSCGMKGKAPGEIAARAVQWGTVPPSCVALDVVYAPRDTPFLASARGRGLAECDGLGMLARQGALAFSLWLGVPAPLEAMLAAAAC